MPKSFDGVCILSSADDNESNQEDRTDSAANSNPSNSISSASLVGVRLGDYQVLRKLGKGGMADVYAARHLSLGRDVAIKVLRSEFARDQDYVARFRREARAAAKLNHPNIVQVYDVGDVNEIHFIAQELIDGQNLREQLSSQGSLSTGDAIKTLKAVGSALQAASEVGITHRDIKPENIMRSSRGDIKVADFGLARLGGDSDATRANLTQAGLTMGTPRYMSPEQVQGKVADVRSDLYSLGVTMYHLVAGQPPFDADEPLALAVKHLHETPEPIDRIRGKDDLPDWLIAVISRLMGKLPEDRYQSPQELLAAIDAETSTSDARYETIGTAAATVRLQRAADASVRKRRSRVLRWVAMSLLPILAAAGAVAYALHLPVKRVDEMLHPDSAIERHTVKEQFWDAMTLDDAEAWIAVSKYFPADASSENRDYYAKSMIQLARMQTSQHEYREADRTIRRLLTDPQVGRRFQLIALSRHCVILEKLGLNKELQSAKRQLSSMHSELSDANPDAIDLFNRVIDEKERLQFQEIDPEND